MALNSRQMSYLLIVNIAMLGGCGKKPAKGGGGSAPVGAIEVAFIKTAAETGVPVRYMMAVAWLESRLTATAATANYLSEDDGDQAVARGTVMTETAFGLTQEALGLDLALPDSSTLPAQIAAYGLTVQRLLRENNLTLPPNPVSEEDKFNWMASLAAVHRQGLAQRRNVRVLFAEELIKVLNEGFVWQDPDNEGERLQLQPEQPPIDVSKFPQNGQAWFQLDKDIGDIDRATFMPLASVSTGSFSNKPKRVEVIHCPLSLSACLELQTRCVEPATNPASDDGDAPDNRAPRCKESDVYLAAHYVIPPLSPADEGAQRPKILQVVRHKNALVLTNSLGQNTVIDDAIVIMLAGNSGRILSGARRPAIPAWFTDRQLRAMAQVVNDVCTLMWQENPKTVDRNACMSSRGDNGVRFRHQIGQEYRWGDIADFDPTIFDAYLASPTGLGTEAAFEFAGNRREYRAGESIQFTTLFSSNARSVELERLSRCRDGRVVWEPVDNQPVLPGHTRHTFNRILLDSGPNGNGDQFFRARIYERGEGKLLGWTIDRVVLSDYEEGDAFASSKYCEY